MSYTYEEAVFAERAKDRVSELELDRTGAPIFVGVFNETLQIGDTTIEGEPDGIYVAKLDLNAALCFVRLFSLLIRHFPALLG